MTPQQALARLQEQCSKCEYSTGQIRGKLKLWNLKEQRAGRTGFTPEEMEGIVSSLLKERFVDDSRFANAYVRDKIRFAKWGPSKISYNLKKLGVDPYVIKCALDENAVLLDDGLLQDLLIKKWNSLKQDEPLQTKRMKLLRFALGRGFGYEQIMDIVKDFGHFFITFAFVQIIF